MCKGEARPEGGGHPCRMSARGWEDPRPEFEEGCHLAGSLDCIMETQKPWNRDRSVVCRDNWRGGTEDGQGRILSEEVPVITSRHQHRPSTELGQSPLAGPRAPRQAPTDASIPTGLLVILDLRGHLEASLDRLTTQSELQKMPSGVGP